MNAPAERDERRRSTCLLVSFAIVAAFTIATWDRLSLPFSTGEALFVHEALRVSGQAPTPDFSMPDNRAPARVLAFIQQLVGTSERSLRLVFLLLLAASAWFLAELLPVPGAAAVSVLTIGLLSYGSLDPVNASLLPILPTALALLAAPLGPRVTNLRALLGLAGMIALGAMSMNAALATGGALVAISLVRGGLLERLTGLVTAAAGIAAAWALGSYPSSTSWTVERAQSGVGDSFEWWKVFVAAYGVAVLWSIFIARDRRQRFALAAGLLASMIPVVVWLSRLQQLVDARTGELVTELRRGLIDFTDVTLAIAGTRATGVLLLAFAACAFRPPVRVVLVLGLLALLARGSFKAPVSNDLPLAVLAEARAVAQPGAALAVEGEHRVAVAVYARLGHAPSMPVFYVPEEATIDGLAQLCKKTEVSQLWLHPLREQIPAGFSAPESRPASVRNLMPLVVD